MSRAYILFNGIQYPFPVAEAAISWARQSKAVLVALFIRSAEAPKEGYVFPSDLDAAEKLNTTDDASSGYDAVIESNIGLLTNEARRYGVDLQTKILIEPTDDDLLKELAGTEMIFASDAIGEQKIMTVDSVDWERILHEHPARVFHE